MSVFRDDGYFFLGASYSSLPGSFYIDPFFAPMQPIFCIDKSDISFNLAANAIKGPDICFLVNSDGGSVYPFLVYPVMGQASIGDSSGLFSSCTCPRDENSYICNNQDYLYTFIQSRTLNPQSVVDIGILMQQSILSDIKKGFSTIFNQLLPVISYSLFQSYGYSGYNYNYPAKLLQDAWDLICPSQDCSAVIFESFSDPYNTVFQAANPFNLQLGALTNLTYLTKELQNRTLTLPKQMCTDSLSQHLAMTSFSVTPPVNLTQSYFECRSNLKPALLASIGR